MFDFITAVKSILEERGKSTKELFSSNIVSENTFYKYKQRYPSIKTLFKIVNYLQVSLDYFFEFKDENNFSQYSVNTFNFYNNLIALIKSKNISGRKFCNDLNYSRDNIIRWKNGTMPSVQALLEITKYFNCSIDELIK